MKKSSIICGAALAIFSFSSCIENTPSAGVEAIRNGQAAKLNADAEAALISANNEALLAAADVKIKEAEVAYKAAETATQQAKADYEQTKVTSANLDNQKKELLLEVTKSEIALAILKNKNAETEEAVQSALDVLKIQNATNEEIARAEMALATKRYELDKAYLDFQKDSLLKLEAVEDRMQILATQRLAYETALAQSQRDAEDAAWDLANTLTAQQNAETRALVNKWFEYSDITEYLINDKLELSQVQYDIALYETYADLGFKGEVIDRTKALAELQEDVDEAQEFLDEALQSKADKEAYLAYLENFPATADEYTKEFIALETELENLSGEIGKLELEKELALQTYNIDKVADQEKTKEAVDSEYDKVTAIIEGGSDVQAAYDKARIELEEFVDGSVFAGSASTGVKIYTFVDGDFEWESASEAFAKNPGDIEDNYAAMLDSKLVLELAVKPLDVASDYENLWISYWYSQEPGSKITISQAQLDWADNVMDMLGHPEIDLTTESVKFPIIGASNDDKAEAKETIREFFTNGGLKKQIDDLEGSTDESLQILRAQLQQQLAVMEGDLTALETCITKYYETWKALDDAFNAATADYKVENDKVAKAKETFEILCAETYSSVLTYDSYEANADAEDVIYTVDFTFAKEDELNALEVEFDQKEDRYIALGLFIDGGFEYQDGADEDKYGRFRKDFKRVNISTIEYADGSLSPYDTDALDAEIANVKAELEADNYGVNLDVKRAEQFLEMYTEILAEATAKPDFIIADAMLEVLEIKEADLQKEIELMETRITLLLGQIDELTAAVNAQSITAQD